VKLTRIKVSDILHQVERGVALLEYAWPWKDIPNPAHVLMFRDPESYNFDGVWGWYQMRVWITDSNRTGYLRDSKCPFELVRDIPMQMLWEELQEIYVMGKLADDPFLIGPHPSLFGGRQYHSERLEKRLNLVYDVRYPELGYENKRGDYLESYERRLV